MRLEAIVQADTLWLETKAKAHEWRLKRKLGHFWVVTSLGRDAADHKGGS